ncbi:hypothetical protein CcaverHIS641_0311230 [Cutaneotrichosporon cavernicola]|nr:hypothetical protein CcaverHIS641_0311230 [Cutaneotrichosporon cavernicola]
MSNCQTLPRPSNPTVPPIQEGDTDLPDLGLEVSIAPSRYPSSTGAPPPMPTPARRSSPLLPATSLTPSPDTATTAPSQVIPIPVRPPSTRLTQTVASSRPVSQKDLEDARRPTSPYSHRVLRTWRRRLTPCASQTSHTRKQKRAAKTVEKWKGYSHDVKKRITASRYAMYRDMLLNYNTTTPWYPWTYRVDFVELDAAWGTTFEDSAALERTVRRPNNAWWAVDTLRPLLLSKPTKLRHGVWMDAARTAAKIASIFRTQYRDTMRFAVAVHELADYEYAHELPFEDGLWLTHVFDDHFLRPPQFYSPPSLAPSSLTWVFQATEHIHAYFDNEGGEYQYIQGMAMVLAVDEYRKVLEKLNGAKKVIKAE